MSSLFPKVLILLHVFHSIHSTTVKPVVPRGQAHRHSKNNYKNNNSSLAEAAVCLLNIHFSFHVCAKAKVLLTVMDVTDLGPMTVMWMGHLTRLHFQLSLQLGVTM